MKFGPKPVHRCYICLLNQGDTCWKFACPRRQWSGRRCEGFENEALYQEFREWQDAPHVKTRKQLRQEAFRGRRKEPTMHSFRKVRSRRTR